MTIAQIKHSIRPKFRIARRAAIAMVSSPPDWKYLPEWLSSFRDGYLLEKKIPWMCYAAIDYLDSHVPANPRVFEYGSGASTLYWLSRGAHVTSVEHDATWYAILQKRVAGEQRLDYRLVEPIRLDDSIAADASNPDLFCSANQQYIQYEFSKYVTQIDNFPDVSFDVVVVDGRSRAACVKHAIPKVKPGGLLVLDNAQRSWYLTNTRKYLSDFTLVQFRGLIPSVDVVDPTNVYVRKVQQ